MGVNLLQIPQGDLILPRTHGFATHFNEGFVTGGLLTDTSGDTGASVASVDAAGGKVRLTTGATQHNEAYMHTTVESFLFADNKPAYVETLLNYTEANTDDAAVMTGWMNAVGADSIVDTTGLPKSSFSGAVIYKTPSDTTNGNVWKVGCSIGTTQQHVALTAANSINKRAQTITTSATRLRIEFVSTGTSTGELRFFIDDVCVYKISQWSYTSATEMIAFIGAKNSSANSEVVDVDYFASRQAV